MNMNANNANQAAASAAAHIPYYYLYGRAARARPVYPIGYGPLVPRYGRYDSSTPNFFPSIDQGPQTVEQLLEQGYFAPPARQPETAVLHDRRETTGLGLDDVLTQIDQRQTIYRENMLDLAWSECYAFNELARGGWPATLEQQTVYEQRMQRLRSEQRAERVSLWQDISKLRQSLPEVMQQYLSAFRKLEILDGPGGDAP